MINNCVWESICSLMLYTISVHWMSQRNVVFTIFQILFLFESFWDYMYDSPTTIAPEVIKVDIKIMDKMFDPA